MNEEAQSVGVDFHCHLDLYPDHRAVIARAEAARIHTLTVTTTPKAWRHNHDLTRDMRYVRAALGLHPQLVAERASELSLWEQYLPETRYVGEVGMDAGPKFYKSIDSQAQVFHRVLERCAEAGSKILTVHSVRCVRVVLDMVERHLPQDRGIVVLHWFTGTKSDARRAAALGCYFSVNADMMCSDRGRAVVAHLPMDRLLTETDGPFTQINGRSAEPADVRTTNATIAQVRNLPVDRVAIAIRANLQTLLKLNMDTKAW